MTQIFGVRVGLSRVLGVAAVLCLAAAVQAQEAPPATPQAPGAGARGGRRGQGGGRQQREMPAVTAFKASSPTAEQQTKFDALQTKMRDDMMAMRNDASGGDMRTKMQDMNKKFQDDTLALLTPDQQKTYKLELAKAQGDLNAQLESLGLTADEMKQVRPLVRDTQQEIRKLGQDNTLSTADRTTKTADLLKDLKAKVRPLISADKQTKLDAMELKAAAGGRGGFGGGAGGGGGRRVQGGGAAAGAEGGAGTPPPVTP